MKLIIIIFAIIGAIYILKAIIKAIYIFYDNKKFNSSRDCSICRRKVYNILDFNKYCSKCDGRSQFLKYREPIL